MRTTMILLLLLIAAPLQSETHPAATLEASRLLAQSFAQQLGSALRTALAEGGPEQAILVCRDQAPLIASTLARQSGAQISRTSRRFRNPLNAPQPWQEEILNQYFDPASQTTDKRIEYFAENADTVRYMQAIRLGGVCAVCHGQAIPESVQAVLDREYPHDQARGYVQNELRGAFSISWPAGPAQP